MRPEEQTSNTRGFFAFAGNPAGDGISLTQSAGMVGAAKFVSFLGVLAASMVLTRVLSRDQYGNYEQVWLVYNSFLPLLGFGLSSAVYFYSARQERRVVYSAAAVATTVAGVVTGVVLVLLAPSISGWFNAGEITVYIRIYAVYAVISSASFMFEAVFVTEKKVGLLLMGNTIVAFLFAVLVSFSAFEFHSLTAVFVSIIAVGVVKSFYLFWFLIKSRNVTALGLSPAIKAQIIYALPIIVSGVTGTIANQIDKYLVTFFFSPDQFAVYAVGSREIPLINVITGSAAAVLFPVFSELGFQDMREKFVELWKTSISKTGLFLLPMMVFLLFTAKDFMWFFFGEKYVPSAIIFRLYLLLIPLRLAFFGQALLALGKQKLFMYSALGDLVLGGFLSYFLLMKVGLPGAAIGKVVVTYIQLGLLTAFLLIFLKSNIKEFFPWIKIAKILFLSVVGLIPVIFLHNWFESVYLRFPVEGFLFTLVFAVTALLTRSVIVVDLRRLRFVVR